MIFTSCVTGLGSCGYFITPTDISFSTVYEFKVRAIVEAQPDPVVSSLKTLIVRCPVIDPTDEPSSIQYVSVGDTQLTFYQFTDF